MFPSYDGTALSYRLVGSGPLLVCLPGGPGCAADYLGDLGGLSARRTLALLDLRGTGASAVPADPATYRMDRLVDDVRAFADHLGLDRVDLLGHSAGGNVALLFAAAHPARLDHLVLACGGGRVAGLPPIDGGVDRSGEPWYADASAAAAEFDRDDLDPARIPELRARVAPFSYGRWDDAARAHAALTEASRRPEAAAGFYAGFDPDLDRLRADLRNVDAPVLATGGSLDVMPTRPVCEALAALFPRGRVAIIEGGGHQPWLDDPAGWVDAVDGFLAFP